MWPQLVFLKFFLGLPGGAEVKNPPHAHAEDKKRHRFDPGLGRFPEEDNPLQILAWKIPWTEQPGGFTKSHATEHANFLCMGITWRFCKKEYQE